MASSRQHRATLSDEERAAGIEAVLSLRGALNATSFYTPDHPAVTAWTDQAYNHLRQMLGVHPEVAWKLMDGEVVVGTVRLSDGMGNMKDLCDLCEARGVLSIIWLETLERNDVRYLIDLLRMSPADIAERGGAEYVLNGMGARGLQVAQLVDASVEEGQGPQGRLDASRVYSQALNCVRNLMDNIRAGQPIEFEQLTAVAAQTVDMVLQDPAAMLAMTTLQSYDAYTFAHCVNVCILSLALASKLGLSRSQLLALGVAGLAHDIGKVKVPLEVLRKPGKMSDEDWAHMRRHPSAGAAILGAERRAPDLAVVVALEHHMQNDLSGYPRPYRPRQLNPCSLMVSIADCYDALTTYRPYRDPLAPHAALAVLQESPARLYDQRLLQYFCLLMGAYPVGCGVKLATGEQAVVVKANPVNGRLPVVGIISNREGHPLPSPRFLDLAVEGDESSVGAALAASELMVKPSTVIEAFRAFE